MTKTLSQFKREVSNGSIKSMTLLIGVKEAFKGVEREIAKTQSNGLYLLTNGRKSWLEYPKASLFEYDEDVVRMYYPGERELNTEEQRIMNEWKEITSTTEYKKQEEIDMLSDGSSTFYQKKRFFINKGMEYLLGFNKISSYYYDTNKNIIRDDNIKGSLMFEYRLNYR